MRKRGPSPGSPRLPQQPRTAAVRQRRQVPALPLPTVGGSQRQGITLSVGKASSTLLPPACVCSRPSSSETETSSPGCQQEDARGLCPGFTFYGEAPQQAERSGAADVTALPSPQAPASSAPGVGARGWESAVRGRGRAEATGVWCGRLGCRSAGGAGGCGRGARGEQWRAGHQDVGLSTRRK